MPSVPQDFTGQVFGRLTIIRFSHKSPSKIYMWVAVCECGVERTNSTGNLRRSGQRPCGCHSVGRVNHGDSKSLLYRKWASIRERCYNPNYKKFKHYGGKGVTVCDEWRYSWPSFKTWCLANGYQKGLEIDRIESSKGYSPGNCRFVTHYRNILNRDLTITLTAFGETKPMSDWVNDERCSVNWNCIRQRLLRGWDHERCIATPNLSKR